MLYKYLVVPLIPMQCSMRLEVFINVTIIELVDSISKGWPGFYIYVIHYKTKNSLKTVHFQDF